MHTKYDRRLKHYCADLLGQLGRVEHHLELGNTQPGLLFQPHEPLHQPQQTMDTLGVWTHMVRETCLVEPFHHAPSSHELLTCRTTQLMHVNQLGQQHPGKGTIPLLWVIAAGHPQKALEQLGLWNVPLEGWPAGFYGYWALRWAVVSLSQLPERPETLVLRLMGTTPVMTRALHELRMLPLDHPIRLTVLPAITSHHQRLERITPQQRSHTEEAFLAATIDLVA
ncbi:MAG: hypothetical protein AAFS10_14765 [Myxococcota bacterium]